MRVSRVQFTWAMYVSREALPFDVHSPHLNCDQPHTTGADTTYLSPTKNLVTSSISYCMRRTLIYQSFRVEITPRAYDKGPTYSSAPTQPRFLVALATGWRHDSTTMLLDLTIAVRNWSEKAIPSSLMVISIAIRSGGTRTTVQRSSRTR